VSVTPLTVPFDVVVVDPDLLWRVDAMNAFDDVMVKDMVTVLGATDELTPGHPAVVLLGPAASVESDDQLPVLRSMFPEVRVVSVADARLASAPAPPSPSPSPDATPGRGSDHPAAGPPSGPGGPGESGGPTGPGEPPAPGGPGSQGRDRAGGHLSLVPDRPDQADQPDRPGQADRADQAERADPPGRPSEPGTPAEPGPLDDLNRADGPGPSDDASDLDRRGGPGPSDDAGDRPEPRDDLDDVDDPAGRHRAPTAPAPTGPAPWFDRVLPAATPMDTIVAVTLEELAVARDDAAATSGQAAARPRLVLVTGAKAGEGTTTLAVNLAAAATRAGARVVLVEADPILGDLALMLGLPAVVDALVTHPTTGIRLQVLPPAEDPFDLVDARVLTETLAALQTGRTRGGPVDLVILDAPATVVRRTGVAALADRVLVTCTARLPNVKNARVLVDELGVIASEVVLNRTGRQGLAEEKIEDLIGAPVVAELPDSRDLEPARFDTVAGILGERSAYARALGSLVSGVLAGRASTGGRRPPPPPRYLPSAPLPDQELPRPPGAPQG
jgi:Mrp family chromosome partitioning ATPase